MRRMRLERGHKLTTLRSAPALGRGVPISKGTVISTVASLSTHTLSSRLAETEKPIKSKGGSDDATRRRWGGGGRMTDTPSGCDHQDTYAALQNTWAAALVYIIVLVHDVSQPVLVVAHLALHWSVWNKWSSMLRRCLCRSAGSEDAADAVLRGGLRLRVGCSCCCWRLRWLSGPTTALSPAVRRRIHGCTDAMVFPRCWWTLLCQWSVSRRATVSLRCCVCCCCCGVRRREICWWRDRGGRSDEDRGRAAASATRLPMLRVAGDRPCLRSAR